MGPLTSRRRRCRVYCEWAAVLRFRLTVNPQQPDDTMDNTMDVTECCEWAAATWKTSVTIDRADDSRRVRATSHLPSEVFGDETGRKGEESGNSEYIGSRTNFYREYRTKREVKNWYDGTEQTACSSSSLFCNQTRNSGATGSGVSYRKQRNVGLFSHTEQAICSCRLQNVRI